MTTSTVLLVALILVVLTVCTVSTMSTLYLIYAYRALVPYDRLVKKVLSLEASQDELERQIEVQRKSFAGVRSASKKQKPAPVSDDDLTADDLRAIAAAGGYSAE